MNLQQKILVALSGGIDSAVAAALLMEQGYEVVGVYLNLLADEGEGRSVDARKVAQELGIDFYQLECEEQFTKKVIDNFCTEYLRGHTPNPCVLCNRYFKFGRLLQFADELGIEFLATGHYVSIDCTTAAHRLCRAKDTHKDQSYFLFTLTEDQLSRVKFPLAETTKEQAYQIAQRWNLSARHQGESQDICFIPDNDYVNFLETKPLPFAGPGAIVYIDGTVLGQHNGIYRYTIGQRRGLGISWPEPLYVVTIDAAKNRIIVGEKKYLLTTKFAVENTTWTHPINHFPLRVDCRIRYRQRRAMALISLGRDQEVMVEFDQPQTGVTPGQAAVFYDNDCVIGGGWIR